MPDRIGQTKNALKLPFAAPKTDKEHAANARWMETWGNKLPAVDFSLLNLELSAMAHVDSGAFYEPEAWHHVGMWPIYGFAESEESGPEAMPVFDEISLPRGHYIIVVNWAYSLWEEAVDPEDPYAVDGFVEVPSPVAPAEHFFSLAVPSHARVATDVGPVSDPWGNWIGCNLTAFVGFTDQDDPHTSFRVDFRHNHPNHVRFFGTGKGGWGFLTCYKVSFPADSPFASQNT